MHRRKPPQPGGKAEVESLIAALPSLPLNEVRAVWKKHLNSTPPSNRSRELVLRLLAWELQAAALGGLTRSTQKQLLSAQSPNNADTKIWKPARKLGIGAVLMREWKGVAHTVKVTAGGYEYAGAEYKNLSVIARKITRTRWSGPRFFGLEQKPEKKSGKATT